VKITEAEMPEASATVKVEEEEVSASEIIKIEETEGEACSTEMPNNLAAENESDERNKSKCVYCKDTFVDKTSLLNHVESGHKDIQIFKCKDCKIFFKNLKSKKSHCRSAHKYRCTYCKVDLGEERALKKHMKEEHKQEMRQNNNLSKFTALFLKGRKNGWMFM